MHGHWPATIHQPWTEARVEPLCIKRAAGTARSRFRREDAGPRHRGEGRKVVRYVSSQANSGHSQPPTAASGTRGRPFTVLLIAST